MASEDFFKNIIKVMFLVLLIFMLLIEQLDTSFDTFTFILLQLGFNENIIVWINLSFHL